MATLYGVAIIIMRLKKSCNCRGGDLTKETWNDFLFFELQQANKNGKDRAIVIHNNELTSLDNNLAEMLEKKKYGFIKAGINRVADIEIYENPLKTL